MLQPNCNILEIFSKDDRMAIRKIVISMVLSTDNANHSSLIESFTRMRVSDSMNLDESANDQLTLLSMLLHSMDVSNVARPWVVSRKWLELITLEFYAQGDTERCAGIAVTPIMDRHTVTPMSQLQTGFISYVVGYAMICCAMLCYDVLCYAMLCYAMLCYAMLCYAMLCYAMLCYAVLCYAMLCCAMLCYAMLCYAMLCYDMICYDMLCYAVLCYTMI
jgi:hypothetical protein